MSEVRTALREVLREVQTLRAANSPATTSSSQGLSPMTIGLGARRLRVTSPPITPWGVLFWNARPLAITGVCGVGIAWRWDGKHGLSGAPIAPASTVPYLTWHCRRSVRAREALLRL